MTPISGDFRLLFHENEKSLPRLKPFGQGTACAQRGTQQKNGVDFFALGIPKSRFPGSLVTHWE